MHPLCTKLCTNIYYQARQCKEIYSVLPHINADEIGKNSPLMKYLCKLDNIFSKIATQNERNFFMKANRESKTAPSSKSNLIQLLKTLSKEEMKAFDKFVHSPFHNNRKEVTRYFLLLKKYNPSFSHQELIAGKIYKKIYPGKGYKDNVMRRLSSNLFQLAEDYLAISRFNKHKYPFSVSLLISLFERGLDNIFMKTYANIISEFSKVKIDDDTFYIKCAYENIYMNHNAFMGRERDVVTNVIDNGVYHILHFFSVFPTYYNNILVNKGKYNYEPKQNLTEKFLLNFNLEGFLNGIDVSQNEYLKLLPVYIYQLLLFQNEKYYYLYKTALLKHKNILSDDVKEVHFSALQNYCTYKKLYGEHKFVNEAYEVIMLRLNENLLIYKGHIELVDFLNVVTLGLEATELNFVEKFIREYKGKLLPEVREDMLNLCRAEVYFERRQFEKALEEVNKVKYEDSFMQRCVKFLLSKIYYEMDYAEQLISHIDTYRHYIINKKTHSKNIEDIRKFLNYLQKLNTLKAEPDSEKLYAVKQSLNDKDKIMDCSHKDWLLEKIEELEKKEK